MKKISLLMVLALLILATSCAKPVEEIISQVESTYVTEKVSENVVKVVPKEEPTETKPSLEKEKTDVEESEKEPFTIFDDIKNVHPGTAGSSIQVLYAAAELLNMCKSKLPVDVMAKAWLTTQDEKSISDIKESFSFVLENIDSLIGENGKKIFEENNVDGILYGGWDENVLKLAKGVLNDVINADVKNSSDENDIEEVSEEENIIDEQGEVNLADDAENGKSNYEVGKYAYSNTIDEKVRSVTVPESEKNVIDLNAWQYGMTPIEWIYVSPDTQLISNNKPNSSQNFGYKVGASSGSEGCYIPIFTKCETYGSDYEGRMYVYEDYTKVPIEEMRFNNKFDDLMYGDYNVKELLKRKYNIVNVSKGVVLAGDMYVNVVYVSELNEIIEGMGK